MGALGQFVEGYQTGTGIRERIQALKQARLGRDRNWAAQRYPIVSSTLGSVEFWNQTDAAPEQRDQAFQMKQQMEGILELPPTPKLEDPRPKALITQWQADKIKASQGTHPDILTAFLPTVFPEDWLAGTNVFL